VTMSFQLLRYLSPPPVNLSPDYDGLEWRWKFLTFRPALFQNEVFCIVGVLIYVAVYFIGKSANKSRAQKWFAAHGPLYADQFSKPVDSGTLLQDGQSDFFAFSTGRRAVSSLHTTFTLRPRHDLFQLAYQFFRGFAELDYRVQDEVELDFTFKETAGKEGAPECVWAIVSKNEMRGIKSERWDLTFTKTSDASNLPPTLIVMSEFADITTNLLKPYGSLSLPTVLSSPDILPYFRSLSLTDQPRSRPAVPLKPEERTKHLILSLALPPASDAAATLPLIAAVFQLVDVIAGTSKIPGVHGGLAASLRPETRSKLHKRREEADREIKEEAAREKREEQAEEKAAAKRKAEEARLSKLSASEQKKELERERKRVLRKSQGKVKTR